MLGNEQTTKVGNSSGSSISVGKVAGTGRGLIAYFSSLLLSPRREVWVDEKLGCDSKNVKSIHTKHFLDGG